jgi:hypothetical protein
MVIDAPPIHVAPNMGIPMIKPNTRCSKKVAVPAAEITNCGYSPEIEDSKQSIIMVAVLLFTCERLRYYRKMVERMVMAKEVIRVKHPMYPIIQGLCDHYVKYQHVNKSSEIEKREAFCER